jgi:hypothetical protein
MKALASDSHRPAAQLAHCAKIKSGLGYGDSTVVHGSLYSNPCKMASLGFPTIPGFGP